MKKTGRLGECMLMANATTRMLHHWMGVSDITSSDAYPVLFNYAFTCELYLKAIMMSRSQNSEFDTGHNLKSLFDKLNQDDQSAIRANYENSIRDENGEVRFWSKGFDTDIDELKNVFNEWRYAFEQHDLCVQASCLTFLAKSIREHACKVTGYQYVPLVE